MSSQYREDEFDGVHAAHNSDVEIERTMCWGGPGRGQGRHKEPGYQKPVKMRFLNEAEEEAIKEFTPRQRVEILLAAASARKPNNALATELLPSPR